MSTTAPPTSGGKTSYQATTLDRANLQPLQPKHLGYTPFEYWKGPKPVIPGSKRTPGPIATGRATTITVTALDTSSNPKAQHSSGAVASLVNPGEKQERLREKGTADLKESMGWTDTYNGARAAGPNSFQVHDHNGAVELVSGRPPSYSSAELPARDMKSQYSNWDPRGWRKRTWAGVAGVVIVAIVAGVVAGVLVAKANRYPDYSKLTYALEDTCKSLRHNF